MMQATKVWWDGEKLMAEPIDTAAIYKEQPAQQEPVAWPCVIAEADFEQNTITLEMKCSDYKVGAGQHWLHTSPPEQRKPLTLWTETQHERAYRNSPELHKDVKSLAAFKRVAKEIAAMYGIKENT